MLRAISKFTKDGHPVTNEERMQLIKELTESGNEARASRLLDMGYQTFTIGNGFIEEAIEILNRYGLTDSKLKTLTNNLMQSFDAFDKYVVAMNEERKQLCNNIDILRELLEAFAENDITVERGPYFSPKLFLPEKK